MSLYNNYIGIGIGKFNFIVSEHGLKKTQEYNNDTTGIKTFIKDFKKSLIEGLCSGQVFLATDLYSFQ